jgi:hypothetical protein
MDKLPIKWHMILALGEIKEALTDEAYKETLYYRRMLSLLINLIPDDLMFSFEELDKAGKLSPNDRKLFLEK